MIETANCIIALNESLYGVIIITQKQGGVEENPRGATNPDLTKLVS